MDACPLPVVIMRLPYPIPSCLLTIIVMMMEPREIKRHAEEIRRVIGARLRLSVPRDKTVIVQKGGICGYSL